MHGMAAEARNGKDPLEELIVDDRQTVCTIFNDCRP
jgi:hypothetical protein